MNGPKDTDAVKPKPVEAAPGSVDTQKLVEELAAAACLSLFEAYGVRLTPVEGAPSDAPSLTSIIGLTGPGITGMCLLAGGHEPLTATNPTNGSLRDWIAELANQLAGRLKHKLIKHGAPVYVTTPVVLRGARIEPMPRRNLMAQVFAGAGGLIHLWVEVETAENFSLTPEAAEETANEGDTLLF